MTQKPGAGRRDDYRLQEWRQEPPQKRPERGQGLGRRGHRVLTPVAWGGEQTGSYDDRNPEDLGSSH